MKRIYRLPKILGGGAHESAEDGDDPGYPQVGFDLDGVSNRLWLDREDLVEVGPPLPPEPPVGAYRVGGVLCMRVSSEPGKCWVYQTHDEMFSEETFDWLCREFGTDVDRLVAAPKSLTLPWRDGPLGVYVDLNGLGGGPHKVVVSVRGHTAHVTSLIARATADALWSAAADAAEAQP